MQKLISIITSTYNCGHLIHRLLDSILGQTYGSIEIFVIDDGSTDNTKQIIAEYFGKFHERGFQLKYVYQENQGLSASVNNGLKLIHGDYLVWPDADDWYADPESLEIIAKTLDDSDDEVTCSRCLISYIDETTFNVDKMIPVRKSNDESLFKDCLFCTNGFYWGAGAYMVKTDHVYKKIKSKTIYVEKEAGQNFQLLLPLLYDGKCVTVNKYLYNVLQRSASHSRKKNTFEKELAKITAYHNTILYTLDHMEIPSSEKNQYKDEISFKYYNIEFQICFSHGKKREARIFYKKMFNKRYSLCKKTKLFYFLSYLPCAWYLYKIIGVCYKRFVRLLHRFLCKPQSTITI